MSETKVQTSLQRASLQRASLEYLRLLSFVVEQPEGAVLDYQTVEGSTGVQMIPRNREKLQRAIKRCRRVYSVIPNKGYILGTPETAGDVLGHKLREIDSSVKRAEEVHVIILNDFFPRLPPGAQQTVLIIGAAFGAIRLCADNAKKKVYSGKALLQITETTPIIPE